MNDDMLPQPHDVRLEMRLDSDLMDRVKVAARKRGQSISEFVRRALLRALPKTRRKEASR